MTVLSTRLRPAAEQLADLEIWVVAGLVAGSMLSTSLLPWAASVAVLFWLLRALALGRLTRRTPADWAVLLLALMVPVTLWATAVPEKTFPQTYRLLSGIALFYAIVNWGRTGRRLKLILGGLVLAGLLLALSAPVTVTWAVDKLPFLPPTLYERFTLLVADAINPNVLGGNLALLLPLALAVLLFPGRDLTWPVRLFSLLAALGMTAALVLSQSRGAWLALVVVLAALIVLRWRWGWAVLLLGAGAAAVAVYRLGLAPTIERIAYSGTLGSLEGRLEIWSRAIYMAQDFPFTGVGLGTFGDVADVLYPFFLFAPASVPHTHNIFLQLAVDLGLPGLIAWLAILFTTSAAAFGLYRLGRASRVGWQAAVGAGLLASNLALVVHGLTDAVTWGMVRPAPIVWALWGTALAGWITAKAAIPLTEAEETNDVEFAQPTPPPEEVHSRIPG